MKDIMQIGRAVNRMAKASKPATPLNTVTVVPATGDRFEVKVGKLSLEEAQRLVGGDVRRIGTGAAGCLLCDEDGGHKNLPPNLHPDVCRLAGMHAPLVGTVLVVPKGCGW